jgi:hypothetical protein
LSQDQSCSHFCQYVSHTSEASCTAAIKKRQESKGAAAKPGRSKLFDSTTELLSASNDAGDVSLPAGFKQR